jgi:hypothetical protein
VCTVWAILLALSGIIGWDIQHERLSLARIKVELREDVGDNLMISITNAPLQPTLELVLIGDQRKELWHSSFDLPNSTESGPVQATVGREVFTGQRMDRLTVKMRLVSGKRVMEECEQSVAIQRM